MHTSLALVLMVVCTNGATPNWHRSYADSQLAARQAGKPLAIFIAQKAASPEQVAADGQLGSEVNKILAEQYVCVVLDATGDRELVKSLAITKDAGLVLSDRSGGVQAYHHDGKIAQTELAKQLWHYADPSVIVRTTQSNVVQRVSNYPSSTATRPTIVQSC